MPDERGVTHYNVMPIAPLDDQTLYFDAGGIRWKRPSAWTH